MGRSYDAQSTIDLPRMNGGSGATLGAQLVVVGQAEKKPAANVAETLADLAKSTEELQAAVHGALAGAGDAVLLPAHLAEAAAWSGLESWLSGYEKLPPEMPSVAIATRLYAALFADGLVFLRQPVLERWNETERRVNLIAERKLEPDFHSLGGADFLAALRTTHAATGKAAGITQPLPHVPETPRVGQALNAFKASLRSYIAQHVANAARDKTGAAAAVSTRLLAPLTNYEPPQRGKPAAKPATPPAAGAATTRSR